MTHDKRSAVEQVVELLRSEAGETWDITFHAFILLRSLRDAPEQVREAIGGLLRTQAAEHVRPICQMLTDPNPSTRSRAAWALGNIGSPVAIPALVGSVLTDAEPRVRAVAATSLALIRPADDEVIAALRRAIRIDDSADVRHYAQGALDVLLQVRSSAKVWY